MVACGTRTRLREDNHNIFLEINFLLVEMTFQLANAIKNSLVFFTIKDFLQYAPALYKGPFNSVSQFPQDESFREYSSFVHNYRP